MRRLLIGLFLVAVPVAAEPEPFHPPVAASLVAGLATALAPFIVGSVLTSSGETRATQNGGIYLMTAGFALGPIVSHLVAHEWKRAAVFGALPTAAFAAMVVMLELHPEVVSDLGYAQIRIPFALILVASVFSSAGGIADSFAAGARAGDHGITLVPTLGDHRVGLAIGGTL